MAISLRWTPVILLSGLIFSHEHSLGNLSALPANSGPVILIQPESVREACMGSPVSLTVVAMGEDISCQWYRGIPPIGDPIPGAKGMVYQIPAVTIDDEGKYYVVLTNRDGEATSVNVEIGLATRLITGSHNITPIHACTNFNPDKLIFTTPVSGGKPPYHYQWKERFAPVADWTDIENAKSDTYDPPNLILAGNYDFACAVGDQCGSAELTRPKSITIVPDPTVAVDGGGVFYRNAPVTLTGRVTDGAGSISYQWVTSLTGLAGWSAIPGATFADYQPPTAAPGLLYYRVRVSASGAACSKPYSSVLAVCVVSDTLPPVFAAPGPFAFCVKDIVQARFEPSGGKIICNCPDYYFFSGGDACLDLDTTKFSDNNQWNHAFSIHWHITTGGTLLQSGTGQPSEHLSFELPGSATGSVIHEITWWIADEAGNESVPATRNIVINPRPRII